LEADYFVEVYDARETRVYQADQAFAGFTLLDYKPNFYGQVPITVFSLNREWESIFDKVITLQDAYNTLLSAEVDDFQAFCDAYLVLEGIDDIDEDSLHLMKTNRVLALPDGGKASFLYKTISDTQVENMLDRIENSIRKISATPDFTDSSFGTQSGVAIRYKLINFENKASKIEKLMTKALQRRIELICSILSISDGEEIWRDIQIIFTRNLPVDYQDLSSMINQLRGLVSNKTLISQLPFVTDVDAEMDAVAEQNEANASLYNFSTGSSDEEVDDDELLER
jgi:SPP1 family phage portal protein